MLDSFICLKSLYYLDKNIVFLIKYFQFDAVILEDHKGKTFLYHTCVK